MSIPDGMTERCVIYIAEGVYEEHFSIESTKGPITLQGVSAITTVIQYGLYAAIAGSTAKSSTVGVKSDKFIAIDITFANTHPPPLGGAMGQQAVGFLIEGDEAEFYRVACLGAQDTLYDKAGRDYYKNCYIKGSIDIIFKNVQEECIYNLLSYGSTRQEARKMTMEKPDSIKVLDWLRLYAHRSVRV